MRTHHRTLNLIVTAVLLSLLLGSCNMPASRGASVWLDVPLDGLSFPAVQEIKIEGHASGPGGISRVEIWIDGVVLTTINNPPLDGDLAGFHAAWTPPAAGAYTIQAIAFSSDGVPSQPDTARITFGGQPPTPVVGCPSPVGGGPTPPSCVTPPAGCPSPVGGGPTPPPPCVPAPAGCPSPVGGGPTPVTCAPGSLPIITVLVPGTTVEFWANPAEIEAGDCTNIRWRVANAQRVVFGGVDQPFEGSYEACLCADERYSLSVTHLDGSQAKPTVDVSVTGSCETPVPVDGSPPPAPQPAVPASGLTLTCRGSQDLVWLPVSDPSGIAEYRVQAERHSGDNSWQAVSGSVFSGIQGKQTNIGVACGWYYHWRVRAIDGAGNSGGWSGWSDFTVELN